MADGGGGEVGEERGGEEERVGRSLCLFDAWGTLYHGVCVVDVINVISVQLTKSRGNRGGGAGEALFLS